MGLGLPHRKQIKINYETQFWIDLMLNGEIRKKIEFKKGHKNNLSNLLNTIPGSWGKDNLIKNKSKHFMKLNSQLTQY